MDAFASIWFGAAFVLAIVAIRHQCGSFVPHHGTSMGSDIVNQLIWALFSLLTALGSTAYLRWYFSALVFLAGFALSFLIRNAVDRFKRHSDGKRAIYAASTYGSKDDSRR